ncbi:MAG: hypothetical protein ABSH51_29525 [Solirubrobacteraceae bacterium]
MTHPQPPGGSPPPSTARLDGVEVELRPLAERVSEQYYREYPDTDDRYGRAGREWCVHDNLYLLAWAFGAHAGHVTFEEQVLWLSRVLASRDYPLDRLARDLEICADVVTAGAIGDSAARGEVAAILRDGATIVAGEHDRRRAP